MPVGGRLRTDYRGNVVGWVGADRAGGDDPGEPSALERDRLRLTSRKAWIAF
jgi:hypothetical protein